MTTTTPKGHYTCPHGCPGFWLTEWERDEHVRDQHNSTTPKGPEVMPAKQRKALIERLRSAAGNGEGIIFDAHHSTLTACANMLEHDERLILRLIKDAEEEKERADAAPSPNTEAMRGDVADFLTTLRRVNTERYHAWVGDQPLMLCEHCGRSISDANASGSTHCNAPFDAREHSFTREHPYLKASNDAGIMFDALELGGEVGELLNVVKKMEREERGWRGSRAAPEDFADECADVLICLDKLARRRGVDLAEATVRKFNATSDKVGLPHKLPALSTLPATMSGGEAEKVAPGHRRAGKRDWVDCPICGETDMRWEEEPDAPGQGYIQCVNLSCPSNALTAYRGEGK